MQFDRDPIGAFRFVTDDARAIGTGRWEKDLVSANINYDDDNPAHLERSFYSKKAASSDGFDPKYIPETLLYGLENLRKRPGGQDEEG